MAGKTKIEWTATTMDDGTIVPGRTWNPVLGCSRVSDGCTNCYAVPTAHRLASNPNPKISSAFEGLTTTKARGLDWTAKVRCLPERLEEPLHWKTPCRIFVNSLSDLFHDQVPDEFIDKVFAVMALCPQHVFQILTKRPERMRDYISNPDTSYRVAKEIDVLSAVREQGPEEIKPIASYPGYFASSDGFIYSEKRGSRHRLKPDASEQGYMRVQLHADGQNDRRGERLLVHRLILEAFVGPAPTEDAQGRHRDGDPRHNALSNLSWGDQSENWSDSRRHGNHRRYSKLSHTQADEIRRRHASGEVGESLAREFGVSATQIRNIASGAQWAVERPIKWPLPGIWLGVSAENQAAADERIPLLLQTPAAVRFLSLEPLLGPIDLHEALDEVGYESGGAEGWVSQREHGVDLVIVGGESGPGARPADLCWVRALRDQCFQAETPFFFKQWGAWVPGEKISADTIGLQNGRRLKSPELCALTDAGDVYYWPDCKCISVHMAKSEAGRLLDGREWNEMPSDEMGRQIAPLEAHQ
jgi:protein gp37